MRRLVPCLSLLSLCLVLPAIGWSAPAGIISVDTTTDTTATVPSATQVEELFRSDLQKPSNALRMLNVRIIELLKNGTELEPIWRYRVEGHLRASAAHSQVVQASEKFSALWEPFIQAGAELQLTGTVTIIRTASTLAASVTYDEISEEDAGRLRNAVPESSLDELKGLLGTDQFQQYLTRQHAVDTDALKRAIELGTDLKLWFERMRDAFLFTTELAEKHAKILSMMAKETASEEQLQETLGWFTQPCRDALQTFTEDNAALRLRILQVVATADLYTVPKKLPQNIEELSTERQHLMAKVGQFHEMESQLNDTSLKLSARQAAPNEAFFAELATHGQKLDEAHQAAQQRLNDFFDAQQRLAKKQDKLSRFLAAASLQLPEQPADEACLTDAEALYELKVLMKRMKSASARTEAARRARELAELLASSRQSLEAQSAEFERAVEDLAKKLAEKKAFLLTLEKLHADAKAFLRSEKSFYKLECRPEKRSVAEQTP